MFSLSVKATDCHRILRWMNFLMLYLLLVTLVFLSLPLRGLRWQLHWGRLLTNGAIKILFPSKQAANKVTKAN